MFYIKFLTFSQEFIFVSLERGVWLLLILEAENSCKKCNVDHETSQTFHNIMR